MGGAYFTIGSVGRFDEIMTAGKGFIGLAAMIFGNWNPIGAYTSSLIFGFRGFAASQTPDPACADPLGVPAHGSLHRDDDHPDRCHRAFCSARGRWSTVREIC
jgi:hypothetical protein